MAYFYCECCGSKDANLGMLTNGMCSRHPKGPNKGKHVVYKGTEKAMYECKFCGSKYSTILTLTGGLCKKHPKGANEGYHLPAL
jgi:hypothetical protein